MRAALLLSGSLVLASLIALPLLSQDADQLQPVRVRLFDLMDEASWERDVDAEVAATDKTVLRYDFDQSTPRMWFGVPDDRSMAWLSGPPGVNPTRGLTGGSLQLGPGITQDYGRACLVVPVEGNTRVHVRARVRLEANPKSGDASSRECLRIVEHSREVTDPSASDRRRPSTSARESRRHHPSGWDVVEATVVTSSRTATVEVQLLHRTGDSEEAITRFDDLVIEVEPLTPDQVLADLTRRYAPNDGQEARTPWRLRVGLEADVRDAVLINAPNALRLPVQVPTAAHKPQLRLRAGALPETRRVPGDGARLVIAFREGETETTLHELEIDVRRDREQRGWIPLTIDLAEVAGRRGDLIFRSVDVDDEPDFDPLLVATPRIEPAEEIPPGFNVMLIGVDTLRADKMSAFGYERDTTPHLKAMADVGVRFTQCRSQAPWTLPSFSSTLTSLYPSVHNAGRGGHDVWTPIDPTTTSLAEALSRVGYETVGHVANFLISPRYGLDQGFESYTTSFGFESATSDVRIVADWVSNHTTTPWLYFWHIMDPHLPYDTPDDLRTRFADADYAGQFSGGRKPVVPFQVLDPRPGRRWFTHEGPPPLPDLTAEDVQFVADYYDAEIAEVDAAVGELFQALRDSGQWERTVIGFVADHGEGLGDHNHYHHGYTLFDDQVHIPLLLRVPGKHEGLVIDRPVAAIDLAPTLLGALGLPQPKSFMGVDRLAQDAPQGDAFFLEYPTYDSSAQKGWIKGRFKYLHDPVFHTEALYDLVADPREQTDITDQHPAVVAEARAALDAFRWEQLQIGRYHLRVRGKPGQQLELKVTTNDLFDANFSARPQVPEHDFAMDLARQNLTLATTLTEGNLELVFWGRGDEFTFTASLDGQPLRQVEMWTDADVMTRALPASIPRVSIPMALSEDQRWPDPGALLLWLEAGAREMLPVVNTPEEIEALRALGYAR